MSSTPSIESAVAKDWRPPDYRCEMCKGRVPGGIDGWDRHMIIHHGPILRGFFFPPDQATAEDEPAATSDADEGRAGE